MHRSIYTFLLVAVLLVVTVRGQGDQNNCRCRMRLRTGSDDAASTNATISASISDAPRGDALWSAPDINRYNIRMDEEEGDVPFRRDEEEGYVPFRRDQEDVFEFMGPCDDTPCFLVHFQNSGTGTDPSWQLASVEADVTFPPDILTLRYKYNEAEWIGVGDGVTIMPCL